VRFWHECNHPVSVARLGSLESRFDQSLQEWDNLYAAAAADGRKRLLACLTAELAIEWTHLLATAYS